MRSGNRGSFVQRDLNASGPRNARSCVVYRSVRDALESERFRIEDVSTLIGQRRSAFAEARQRERREKYQAPGGYWISWERVRVPVCCSLVTSGQDTSERHPRPRCHKRTPDVL